MDVYVCVPTDAQADDVDLGHLFLSPPSSLRHPPWLFPSFRARVIYALRVTVSMSLSALWVLNPDTGSLFTPGLLIPIAAVCALSLLWACVCVCFLEL